jgi:SAM-dependent methyltransferase
MNAPVGEVPLDWYVDGFSRPSTALLPWADDAEGDVDRVLQILGARPGARILDLACGGGRHTVELASRGFEMVGVDMSSCQLEMGVAELEEEEGWNRFRLEYLEADLRDLEFEAEFDVVLNLNGGAVGYFENDLENRRTFETISRSLRRGGRTLMQLPNVDHAESRLPARTWTEGRWTIELLERHWNPDERCVEGTMTPIFIEDPASMESIPFRQRLYSVEELFELFCSVSMSLEAVLDETGNPGAPTEDQPEIFVVARRD